MPIDAAAGLDREHLRQLLADTIDADVTDVQDDTDFVQTLGVDSLMALEVVVVLERTYGVKFAESEMREVRTLDSAYEVVRRKLGERP
ncbi:MULTISPECIES: acyl carrier protein [Streptomyces]|jgi:acyl carrier protein|uniref:Acyl carrier protein n=2 Tax=Streptomyces TaxID=1883 RepID=A0A0N9M332_9ACTN|nr:MULTISPECIES: acyl carrier protein [Streptomyces]ALG65302.1 Cal34 [Streptomyces calvus]MBA8943014.1 acyl carrier protein [Streptomyces calvus]MBA8978711.1 acyl carrier protein [Streptomyces calvus]MYS28202.1 acyl carrier protein [Streptomyces sp. SID7804]QDI71404.1 polyketide-8 synthase acyl carrier protein [Streptomyces calvus]